VTADASLVTLESDKATMDVPSPFAGTVREVRVKVGDRVGEGSLLLLLDAEGSAAARAPGSAAGSGTAAATVAAPATAAPPVTAPVAVPTTAPAVAPAPVSGVAPAGLAHASPAVRKVARELGVDLARVTGSGPRGRVLQEDVQKYVKQALAGQVSGGTGLDLLPWPKVDFARFGPVETRPLSRIRKIAGANLARNWVMIPHVTQFDEADVTDLEDFRVKLNAELGDKGPKVTLLAFLVKACVAALQRFPEFNSSLEGDSLVLKRYFHVGFAADTPNGLVVPVVRDADRKGVLGIARELGELSAKAREGKLAAADIQGGSFSISSLGGIGGTAFTPIVNAPEVAILGASRVSVRPVWDGERFAPRKMLPLSLSYDHRVIDGAAGARFTTYLAELLRDMRRAML
jgi:pyruvate dehydrogenase E2 component (dihydrolipoamide acetyltransferase)